MYYEQWSNIMSNGMTLLISGLVLGVILGGFLVFIFSKRADRTNKNQQAINDLIQPLNEQIRQFEHAVLHRIDTDIKEELRRVTKETWQLKEDLLRPTTGGKWGEIRLQNVFELVGMTEDTDYKMQEKLKTDHGSNVKPDAIVNLPGNRHIIIDAKTSFDSFLKATKEEDSSTRTKLFEEHAEQLKRHVDRLSKKAYWKQLPTHKTTDFVVMYLPNESSYIVAIEHTSEDLYEYALKKNIVLATPMTLVVLLKAVMLGWQQHRMTENSLQIIEIGNELYDRLKTYFGHVNNFAQSLSQTVQYHDKSIGSLESRLIPSIRKLENLVSASKKELISTPPPVGTNPRTIQISETFQTEQDEEIKSDNTS